MLEEFFRFHPFHVAILILSNIAWVGVAMWERRRAEKWLLRCEKVYDEMMAYRVAVIMMSKERDQKTPDQS